MHLFAGLHTSTTEVLSASEQEESRKAIIDALHSTWPKVQWNAAKAMQRILAAKQKPDPAMIEALWQILKSGKNVKVRRSALTALEAVPESLSGAEAQRNLQETQKDLQSLRGDLSFEDAARAEQLQSAVSAISKRYLVNLEADFALPIP